MLRDCKEERQYLSIKSFQGERRPMALYGENRRSHVTTVEGVAMWPVFVDSVTLPAIMHLSIVCPTPPLPGNDGEIFFVLLQNVAPVVGRLPTPVFYR